MELRDGSGDGIITLSGDDTAMETRGANGLRKSPLTELTDDDIARLREDIKAIGADGNVFLFNKGFQTGYSDKSDRIYVMGDVLPDGINTNHPRDLMSTRAVLAHEYYGHRMYRNTHLRRGAWNDEFRASYMAAKNAPGLTERDKMFLVLDAMERAREAGVTIQLNGFMRRAVYGIDYAGT